MTHNSSQSVHLQTLFSGSLSESATCAENSRVYIIVI